MIRSGMGGKTIIWDRCCKHRPADNRHILYGQPLDKRGSQELRRKDALDLRENIVFKKNSNLTSIQLSPNPARSNIVITSPYKEAISFIVYDSNGRQ